MGLTVQKFFPKDLNDVHTLKAKWFCAKDELDILNKRIAFKEKIATSPPHSITSIRTISILIKAPFYSLISIFLYCIAEFLSALGFDQQALKYSFKAYDFERPFIKLCQKFYWGEKLLVPTYNSYAEKVRYLTQYSDIERKDLKNPFLQKHLLPLFNRVQLNLKNLGLCHGSVNWFNYLILKWGKKCQHWENFLNKESLSKIASLFKNGQPLQAALLQSLAGIAEPLLDLQKHDTIIYQDVVQSDERFLARLNSLADGIYHARIFEVHSISIVKCGTELFIFDPNIGLLKFDSNEELFALLKSYLEDANEKVVIFGLQQHAGSLKDKFRQIYSRVFG